MKGTRQEPKIGWPTVKGLVYSVDWIDPSRNDFGHYNVVYSYRVGEKRFTGSFADYGEASEDYLHPDDMIDIQYNPERQDQSFYPLVRKATNLRLLFIAIGLGAGLIALLILFLTRGFK
jgi:hypothetical protein